MGILLNFIKDNFMIIVFIIVLLILALLGYIIDTSKTNKLKKELTGKSEEDNKIDIPEMQINAKIGDAAMSNTTSMPVIDDEMPNFMMVEEPLESFDAPILPKE